MLRKIICFLFSLTVFYLNSYSQALDTVNLYFGVDKAEITEAHKQILEDLLNKKDAIDIQIYGFTDYLGDVDYNLTLSEKRCTNIKNYLVSKGVNNDKIAVWSGKGVHSGSSAESRSDLNDPGIREHRKVEIIYGKFEPVEEKIVEEVITEEPKEERIPIFGNFGEEELVVGNTIVLENILFYGGTPNFRPESMGALRHLASVMKNNPDLKIEIQGHICCERGGKDGYDSVYDDYNLSSNRARAVYHYLIHEGVEENRMAFKGLGSKYKRYPRERNEDEKSMNRRVEILIIER